MNALLLNECPSLIFINVDDDQFKDESEPYFSFFNRNLGCKRFIKLFKFKFNVSDDNDNINDRGEGDEQDLLLVNDEGDSRIYDSYLNCLSYDSTSNNFPNIYFNIKVTIISVVVLMCTVVLFSRDNFKYDNQWILKQQLNVLSIDEPTSSPLSQQFHISNYIQPFNNHNYGICKDLNMYNYFQHSYDLSYYVNQSNLMNYFYNSKQFWLRYLKQLNNRLIEVYASLKSTFSNLLQTDYEMLLEKASFKSKLAWNNSNSVLKCK